MTRRGMAIAAIACLFATLAAAPIAYWSGTARGASEAAAAFPARNPGEFVEVTDAVFVCDEFGDFDGLRTFDRYRECGPGFVKPTRVIDAYFGPANRRSPLRLATARAIAREPVAPPSAGFMAGPAALPPALDPIGVALSPSAGFRPAQGGGGALPPYVLVSNVVPTLGPPGGPPPDPVPLPAGAPLLLTGLFGLAACKRRSRRG